MTKKTYSYVPLLAMSVVLGAPVEHARPFFEEHKDSFTDDFGAEQTANLDAALDGDVAAALRFAEGLVPGATFELSKNEAGETVCNYALTSAPISGRLTSRRAGDARAILASAASIWDKVRRGPEQAA